MKKCFLVTPCIIICLACSITIPHNSVLSASKSLSTVDTWLIVDPGPKRHDMDMDILKIAIEQTYILSIIKIVFGVQTSNNLIVSILKN